MTDRARIDPSYLEKGTHVGAYEVVDKLGAGGFGCLWKVRREGKAYALKLGKQRLSELDAEDREHYQERLDREIAALKSLHHPNIVRVHAFDFWPELEGGYPYLVMDLVEGLPLIAWRAKAAPSLARLCVAFEKLAAAIEHVHGLGIFHRDLKSDNVLVRADGVPVLIDFGIARPRLALDLTRAASVGTITHYAPEYARHCDSAAFARGEPFDWRPTTDLHAVGYVLYQVLTGERPFPKDAGALASEAAVLLAIKTEVPAHPSDVEPRVPRSLGDVAVKLLEKDPARRPQSARELGELLRAAREAGGQDPAWHEPFDEAGLGVVPAQEEEEEPPRPEASPPDAAEGEAAVNVPDVAPPLDPSRPSGAAAPVFELPTRASRRAFDAGEVSDPTPARPAADPVPSFVREARAQLAASAPRRGPSRLAVAGGALVALVLGAIVLAAGSGAPPEKPRTFLAASLPAGGPEPPSAAPRAAAMPASTAVVPPAPPSAPSRDPPVAEEAEPPRLRPASAPARREARTTPRPRSQFDDPGESLGVEPRDLPPPLVPSRDPPWLHRSTRLASASPVITPAAATPPRPRGIPLGAHLRAKLLTNLDSRTIGSGPVEAMLVVPAMVRGEVALPARTLAYGTATESSGRFNVRFTRLRLPDDTEVEFEALALARDDGKPGLAAARRIQGEPVRQQPGLGTQVAKGTGNILLDTLAGGVGHDIARSAGQAALNRERPAETGTAAPALLLDAGVVFDLWVEKAF